MNKEYLNVKKLSAYIELPTSSIYKMTSDHSIPFSKIGQRLVFKREDIDKWLAKKKQKMI